MCNFPIFAWYRKITHSVMTFWDRIDKWNWLDLYDRICLLDLFDKIYW